MWRTREQPRTPTGVYSTGGTAYFFPCLLWTLRNPVLHEVAGARLVRPYCIDNGGDRVVGCVSSGAKGNHTQGRVERRTGQFLFKGCCVVAQGVLVPVLQPQP